MDTDGVDGAKAMRSLACLLSLSGVFYFASLGWTSAASVVCSRLAIYCIAGIWRVFHAAVAAFPRLSHSFCLAYPMNSVDGTRFQLGKAKLRPRSQTSIQDEFTKKERDREIQERIARSSEIGECRVKKMKIRDDLLQTLVGGAADKCAASWRGAKNYPQVKTDRPGTYLKIEENDVLGPLRAPRTRPRSRKFCPSHWIRAS